MKSISLLLADDDADDTDLFREAIDELGLAIVCHAVENGKLALEALDKIAHPDIIFLDINMPVMGGWECLLKIKANDRLKNIPVIMYSTASNDANIERATALGALCLFTKPDDFKQLKKILSVIFENMEGDLLKSLSQFNNIKYSSFPSGQ